MKGNMIDFAQIDFSRIAVIGCPGSGKTTLACQLAQVFSRPVTHLDRVLWNENWQMLPFEQREQIHADLIGTDTWLIDGMWRSHLPSRFTRSTVVIFLDYKRRVSFSRAVKRFLKFRHKQRADIADGCLEKLDAYFVKYIWNFRKKVRPEILQLISAHPEVRVITLTSPRQTEEFVLALTKYVTNAE